MKKMTTGNIEFTVVTLNCWGIRFVSKDRVPRMMAIADELATGKYDFVFLQEVWTSEDFERIKNRTSDVLPHAYYFYSGVIGSGLCIFSKYEILHVLFHQWAVNGYIHKIQHGDWFGGKGVGMVEVKYRGLVINLYTTHLHAEYNRNNDEYLAHRVIQAFDTAQFIKLTSQGADVVILGGDLNTEPDDLVHRIIFNTAELRDTTLDLGKPLILDSLNTCETPRNSYTVRDCLKVNPWGKRIDYICVKGNKDYQVKTITSEVPWCDRVPEQPFSYSDHEAVVAKLCVTKSGGDDPKVVRFQDAKQEAIIEAIEICNNALKHLSFTRKIYWLLSVVSVFTFLVSVSWDITGMFHIVIPIIRLIVSFTFLFGVLMGVLWHRMEVNGILAGLLAMKLDIGKPPELDEEVLVEMRQCHGDLQSGETYNKSFAHGTS